jgi:hypothetical protein
MKASRSATAALTIVIVVACWAFVGARQAGQLPLEPLGNRGEALFPYLEGWYTNPDGTASFLLGYMNRNTKQSFEIPIGPNNRIEPGAPDQGQPTVFNTGRNNRMFTITVPKDFGNKKITWTLVANNIKQSVTFWQNPPYFVEPFIATGTGNTPPTIKIDGGPDHSGPPRGIAKTYVATVGQPLTLTVWAADKGNTIELDPNPPQRGGGRGGGGRAGADAGRGGAAADAGRGGAAPDAGRGGAADAGRGGAAAGGRGGRGGAAAGPPAVVQIAWARYRGPAGIKVADERLPITDRAGQTVSTTATFSQPGEYWLRVNATEGGGEGGGGSGQCCTTSALVRVNVK